MKNKQNVFSFIAALSICAYSHLALASDSLQPKSVAPQAAQANVSFSFENANLKTFLNEIEKIFKASFIYDEALPDESEDDKKGSKGVKITFRTNNPFTKNQAWNVVDAFLSVAGLARVHVGDVPNVFRITKIDLARKEALPSFIGIDHKDLPDSGLIRYVYFLKNSSADQMVKTVSSLKSKSAIISIYQDLNALIFTDQAYNIKTLMQIVKELDSACTTVALSVLKLKQADAVEVAKIYADLKGKSGSAPPMYGMPAKQDNKYFLQEANVFAEPRTNTLIIIGPPEANAKIEKFITEHIDTKLAKQRSKIHTIELNYIPAEQVAEIFNNLTKFGDSSEASRFGGTRGGEKYFNRMFFESEKQSNRLIVRGEEEDFNTVKEIILDLDKAQPQVAIEVLIVNLENISGNELSSQIHNKNNAKVNMQTSGFGGPGSGGSKIQLSDEGTLVPNLIKLATGASLGSTVISLGKSSVWALLSVLSRNTKTNVLSNPFLVTTNKYPATTSLGEERRVVTEKIQGSGTSSSDGVNAVKADLKVEITPRINSLGTINLDIDIVIESFTNTEDKTSGNKSAKTLHTNANVMDGEVLALGGLVKNSNKTTKSGTPLLSKLPLIGNLFKSKKQSLNKENLIVFITPKIIRPGQNLSAYTRNKAMFATDIMKQIDGQEIPRDPIARWVFKDQREEELDTVNNFIAKDKSKSVPKKTTKKKLSKKRRSKTKPSTAKKTPRKRKSISSAMPTKTTSGRG